MYPFASHDILHFFAQTGQKVENFPLIYQIACIILTALFLLAFSVANNPRSWRRLYQAKLSKKEEISVNRNKKLDEDIKKRSMTIAMIILVIDVALFVTGVTYGYRSKQRDMSRDEAMRQLQVEQFKSGAPDGANRFDRK